MSTADRTLSNSELGTLRLLLGQRLETIDAAIVARNDLSWNTVRLHLGTTNIDVSVQLDEVVVDELGTLDEFGIMHVTPASPAKLAVPGISVETTSFDVGETISGISVVVDTVDIYGNGQPVASIVYTQAIVIGTATQVIALDMESWFSEMVAVKIGRDSRKLVYDGTGDWSDDPDEDPSTHYVFHSAMRKL